MTDVVIYGVSPSTFTRTARMACEEKGITHTLEPVSVFDMSPDEFAASAYARLHPFKKIPAMKHNGLTLFETAAICRYIDATFPGPALWPADIQGQARCTQWMSAIADYVYQVMIREIVIPRVVVPMRGGKTDEAAVAAAAIKAERQLAILSQAVEPGGYLAGNTVTAADLFLLPILFYMKGLPEGETLLPKFPPLLRWFDAMAERPSSAATMPEFAKPS